MMEVLRGTACPSGWSKKASWRWDAWVSWALKDWWDYLDNKRRNSPTDKAKPALLKKSYLKNRKEENKIVFEMWQLVFREPWKLALIILVKWNTCGHWKMAILFLVSNDLHMKGGCCPGHHLMSLRQSEISRSSSLKSSIPYLHWISPI